MPLSVTEQEAREAGVLWLYQRDGNSVGLQSYFRDLGAHSVQARDLASDAVLRYEELSAAGLLPGVEERSVQAQVTHGDATLNIELKADRLPITTFAELVEFYEIDTSVWQPTSQVFNFWGSKDSPNFQVKASFKRDEYKAASQSDREAFREWAASVSPSWEDAPVGVVGGSYMLEVVLSDLHVGAADNAAGYLQQLTVAVWEVVQEAFRGERDVGAVSVVLLGDTFNSEGRSRATTKGTPQDDSVDWRGVFTDTRAMLSDLLRQIADTFLVETRLVVMPGNHDWERSYYLSDSLAAYFHAHPRVSVDVADSYTKFMRWGSTAIGLTHGDTVKPAELAVRLLREGEASDARHLYWHMGHYHTRMEEEVQGVICRWFGSPSNPGEWGQARGYGGNRKEVTGMLFHESEGEVAVFRRGVSNA